MNQEPGVDENLMGHYQGIQSSNMTKTRIDGGILDKVSALETARIGYMS